MPTKIKISKNRGTVLADLFSDPDHLARYTLVLWSRNAAGQWTQLPLDRVVPASSNTLDQGNHHLVADPAAMGNMALQVFVAVSSTTAAPGPLGLRLWIAQGASDLVIGNNVAPAGTEYPIGYNTPVPPGKELTFDAAWEFELV